MKAITSQTVSNFTEVNVLSASQEDFHKVISGTYSKGICKIESNFVGESFAFS